MKILNKLDFKTQTKENLSGVYIHFPYCIQKCDYCDFYSVATKDSQMEEKQLFKCYEIELEERIKQNPEIQNFKFNTIFVGGGTPSRANPHLLKKLLQKLKQSLNFKKDTEVSIEVNPEDLDLKKIFIWQDIGFNRINLGVQTFEKKLLISMNRLFEEKKYETIAEVLRKSPIQRFGADLMYGIPDQNETSFWCDLHRLLKSGINHISLYALTMEKGTVYAQKVKKGRISIPNENLQVELLKKIPFYLKKYGFYQYEVSNFAKKENECKHNLKYWTMEYYLSLGPSSHGFLPKGRYANSRSILNYLKKGFSGHYEKIDYFTELCLCLFRLFKPICLEPFFEKIPMEKKKRVYEYLYLLSKKKICYFEKPIFQWKQEAILNLDFYIFELCNL